MLFLFLNMFLSTTTLIKTINAIPPPPPVVCTAFSGGCTLHNAYGIWGDRKDCIAPTVLYPTTENQLLSIVANATKNKLKLKVVSKFSHTIPKLACPAAGNSSVLISTENYNSNIVIDIPGLTVTADAGVTLRQLIDKVEDQGLSVVASPYWEGVSVGGMIGTGAHGSSWWDHGGAFHDHVVRVSMVVSANENEGFSKILHLDASSQHLFNAAKVSLGMLGIVSKVTINLEKGFKRSITYNFTNDVAIEETFISHAQSHEFADITWYPSSYTAVYRNDVRVPLTTEGDGIYDFIGFKSTLIDISKSTRALETSHEKAKNVKGICTMAMSIISYKKLTANGLKNNQTFTGYPVIGRQGKMQTSGSCLYSLPSDNLTSCPWDPQVNGLFFFENSAIFPARKFGDFIRDVKKLRDLNVENFCGVDIYNGFLIRFIKASEAYLGQIEDSVAVDFTYYRADLLSTPRLNQDVMEEVEQMAFLKYGAKPHWAKNRKVAFLNVGEKYGINFEKFIEAKKTMDPHNVFYNEWSNEILFGSKGYDDVDDGDDDGCALEGKNVIVHFIVNK